MSGRRCSGFLLMFLGCEPEPGPPLSRVTQGWAADTAAQAAAPVSGTLLLAAVSAEICAARMVGDASVPAVDAAFPLSSAVQTVLGSPTVYSVEMEDDFWSQAVLSGVRIVDRVDQWLRIAVHEQEEGFLFEYVPLVDATEADGEPDRMAGFGQISLEIGLDCIPERAVVSGHAMWIDEDNRRHEVSIPADQELGSEVVLGHDVPWLPVSGAIGWESRFDKQRRNLISDDATELRVVDEGVARWPVVVHGPDWSGTALTTIAP